MQAENPHPLSENRPKQKKVQTKKKKNRNRGC